MTQTNQEPTLRDLANKIDHLATEQEGLKGKIDHLATEIDKIGSDQTRFDDKFAYYQQAMQWVIQLAFGLIASATVTVIITSVLKR